MPPQAAVGTPAQVKRAAPRFEDVSRMLIVPLTSKSRPTGGGGTLSWTLPHSHYLARIFIAVRGQIDTLPGSGTLNALGQASIIRRTLFETNVMQEIQKHSGEGWNYLIRPQLDFVSDPVPQSSARSVIKAGLVNLDYWLPLVPNQRDPVGLITLQSNEVEATLSIDLRTDSDLLSGASLAWVTQPIFTPYLFLFTVPPYAASQPNTSVVHKIIEDTRQIAATGRDDYFWPRANLFAQLIHGIGFGATGAKDKWDRATVYVNRTSKQMELTPELMDGLVPFTRLNQRLLGTLPIDLQAYSGLGNYDKLRDGVDTRTVTDIMTSVEYNDTGTLYSVRREFVSLAQPAR